MLPYLWGGEQPQPTDGLLCWFPSSSINLLLLCGLQEKPVDEEEGEFDVIFQLRRKEKLQSLLALVQQAVQGEQRLPEQEFPPLRVASREHQLERYLGLGGLCREGWAAGVTQEETLFLVQASSMLLPGPVPWRGRSMNQLSQPCKVEQGSRVSALFVFSLPCM